MASESNIELVRAGFEALNAGDLDACIELVKLDLIINLAELPEPLHGRDIWRQGAAMFRRAFPDLHAEIEDIFGSGDRVAVRLSMSGTHRGEYLGIPATGRSFTIDGIDIVRIEDGQIKEVWHIENIFGLLQQLGVVPSPEPAAVA